MYKHPKEYQAYVNMKKRVLNPTNIGYANYGGRGIHICGRWTNSFHNFFQDMGPCPPHFSLHRVNNDGHYEPKNCIWADKITQANSTRANRRVELRGRVQTLAQWARELGISIKTVRGRLGRNWSMGRALTEPLHCLKAEKFKDTILDLRSRGLSCVKIAKAVPLNQSYIHKCLSKWDKEMTRIELVMDKADEKLR